MSHSWKTRVLALLLAVFVVVGLVPTAVFAEEATEPSAPTETTEPVVSEEDGDSGVVIDEEAPSEDDTQNQEEGETFTVTFDANGGTGTMEAFVAASGNLPANTFTRDTFSFKGWNTAKDGKGTAYADGAEITLTADITLYAQWHDDYYSVISKQSWDLAPGIKESQIVLNNDAGNMRQVLFVMEADLNNEYVKVINSYTGMVPQYGNYKVSGMTNQAAIAEEMGYGNVVGAMNTTLSWYSGYAADRVNEPLGFIMVDAEIYFDPGNCGYTYGNVGFPSVLVINKDFDENGNPRPADIPKVEMPQIRSAADLDGWEDQVIPCSSGYILKNGVNQASYAHGNDQAPRSVVGFKPDGTAVIMVNDGRQPPYSAGMNMYELAEAMLDLGCTYAVNCDGGGSTTWVSQRPGEEQKINNSPSDGAERSTTTGILFISTAPANGELYKAHISTESNYYTPNSEVQFHAIGTDMGGTEVAIPADAQWQLSDGSFGTIDNTGLFTSNGTEGEVTAQLVYNGEVVGEKAISVVWPTDFAFASAAMTVPFGKTVPIELVATYNGAEAYVAFKLEDITFELSETVLGTIDGFTFTANADENLEVTTGTLTATINGMSAVTTITLGKGSEVIFDFEGDNPADDWFIYDYNVNQKGDNSHLDLIDVVTPETGKVHSGNTALAVTLDYSDAQSNGWIQYRMGYDGECIEIENAKKLGFWIWMPEEAYANEWDLHIRCIDANGNATRLAPVLTDPGDCFTKQDEAGWRYYTTDISKYPVTYFGYHDVAPTSCFYIQFYNYQQAWMADDSVVNTQGKFTYFIDDITIEYSDAADDADAPVFDTMYLVDGNGTASEMNGQTISYNTIGAEVAVADTDKANATGIDPSSAKAYVDGREVNCVYTNGRLSISDVKLADGLHTVKFVICDKMGNLNSAVRQVRVAAGTDIPTVNLVPHDATRTNLPSGSVYYVDLVASNIDKVQKITVDLDLVNTFNWELAYADVAEGFALSYYVEKYENVATITITKTGNTKLSGSQVVASIPVRVWEAKIDRGLLTSGLLKEVYLTIQATRGILECTDGSISTFTCDPMKVASELYMNQWNTPADFAGVTLHKHTAEAIDDCDATCTEKGYTDRTYCEVCASVVDWGTILPATGHSYDFVDGVLQCTCGELFTGVHTDGKAYVDGVVVSDGWVNDSYYKDGIMVTGVQKVPASDGSGEFYYDFGEDGVCAGQTKYSGLFQDGELYRYAYLGILTSGWQLIDNEYYYFSGTTMAAVNGHVKVNGVYFDFEENGKLISGVWAKNMKGARYFYGPSYYEKEWKEIDGEWYYFKNGYRLEGPNKVTIRGDVTHFKWYNFDENGVSHGIAEGLITNNSGNLYYVIDGIEQVGLQKVEDNYYFFLKTGEAVRGRTYYAYETFCDLPVGNYVIGEDGKFVNGIVEQDDGYYYYVHGKAGKEYGLLKIGEDYYFVLMDGKIITNRKYYAWESNCDLPVGHYFFDEEGKLANGIVETDEGIFFCQNGVAGAVHGLIKFEDNYYFVQLDGKIITNRRYYAWETYCDLPEGNYEFGSDGKMLQGVVEKNGTYYLYTNGRVGGTYGLIKMGEDYYFVLMDGTIITNRRYYAWETRCDLPEANYEFGSDGKMLQGVVEFEGELCYFVNGQYKMAGLVEVDGAYYFAGGKKGQVAIGVQYVWQGNGILPEGTYEFGADGKMLQGIVEKEDGYYYYVNGKLGKEYGLRLIDGDYYFVMMEGYVITNKKYYAWETYCDLPVGHYEFGADGKMLQGIVEKDDGYYYYVNGRVGKEYGLLKYEDAYYFVEVDGKLVTNKVQYAWKTDGSLPEANYEFGADGKMLHGIVQKDDGYYYYDMGRIGKTYGIILLDGYYYFVMMDGKLITNRVYHVWEGNGLLIEQSYTFNELGQIVG